MPTLLLQVLKKVAHEVNDLMAVQVLEEVLHLIEMVETVVPEPVVLADLVVAVDLE